MSVGLSGRLEDFGIADVFQLIGQQRKTGILELKGNSGRAQLVFDRGLVVSASPLSDRATDADPLGEMLVRCGLLTRERAEEANTACRSSAQTAVRYVVERGWLRADDVTRIEDLFTRDTIFDILRWTRGSFDFRAQPIEHEKDPASLLGAEQILMDGLRMVDEWNSIEENVPSDDAVFQRVGRLETYRSEAQEVSPAQMEHAEKIFSLIDGRHPARRVIDLSQLGTFDGARAFADLRRVGVLARLDPEGVRQLRRHIRPSVSLAVSLRRGVAVVLPLVLLLAVALSIQWATPAAPAPDDGAFYIEHATLSSVREAHATRRIRNAVEAYRMAEGRWPAQLSELPSQGLLESEALAPPAGRPYYSMNREDGVVLLAPER
jgi:hypothetical protein